MANLWATANVVVWLQNNRAEDKEAWELLVAKALKYLENKLKASAALNGTLSVAGLLEAAEKLQTK